MAIDKSINVIERLRNNIALLQSSYREALEAQRVAQARVQELEAELEAYKEQAAQSKARVKDVETEQQRLIAAQGFIAEEGDAKSARLRVSRLVREIDKCISLLNE